jgi:hypothetical protein
MYYHFQKSHNKNYCSSWRSVVLAYNRSYSGGRDQEDCSSKTARANSSVRPYLEKPFTKIGLVEWLKVKALSSTPSTAKKKKKKKKINTKQGWQNGSSGRAPAQQV